MASNKHDLWVERYRPKTLDEYVFQDAGQEKIIRHMISERSIPHLLFAGVQGTGKTAISEIIISSLELDHSDILTINASDEARIDDIRDRIKNFISTIAMGRFKVVHLEEADYIPHTGQAILRRFMEDYADTSRFILTCNYVHKILPAIVSRCQVFQFKASNQDDIVDRTARILINEKIQFGLDVLDKYVSSGYPDIRKIINLIQQNSVDDVLQPPLSNSCEGGDYKFQLLDLIELDDWVGARNVVCSNVVADEWEYVYRFLYQNLHKTPKFSEQSKWESGIVIIADHLYKHGIVADPEINAAALFIRLGQI
jgi:replication factor C small subunit